MKRMKKCMKRAISIALAAVLLVALSVPMSLPVYGSEAPIYIYGNGVEVHDTVPSAENNTLFINEAQFTIQNKYSNKVMRMDGIEISGDDRADFTVKQNPASELSKKGETGDTTSFVIRCNPTGDELKSAKVKILVSYYRGSDLEEDSISFPIQGRKLYSGGTGAEANPYLIGTADDLKQLSIMVNEGTSYGGIYFKMTNDIALNSNTSNYENWGTAPPASTWAAIGRDGESPFSGNFNGNNHEVSGIYTIDDDVNGLFGIGAGCTIENLGIVESMITSSSKFTGAVIGGITGWGDSTGVLKNCYNKGIVNGALCVGGVAGLVASEDGEVLISNCYNEGKVSTINAKAVKEKKALAGAGGIAGRLVSSSGAAVMQNCRNSGEVSGDKFVGGIVGASSDISEHGHAIVNSCKNTGAVSLSLHKGTADNRFEDGRIGGIVGDNMEGLILNCGSTGRVSAETAYAVSVYAGGIAGVNGMSKKCVLNNYSSSDIEVNFATGGAIYIGGIAGRISADDVINNYYAGNIHTNITGVDAEKVHVGYAFGSAPTKVVSVIAKNYYDLSQTTGVAIGGEPGMAEGVAPDAMRLSTRDDALIMKLNNGIASVGAILTEKGFTTASAVMVSKGYVGVTPSAWIIQDSLNSGYPQFDRESGGHHGNGTPATQQPLINGVPIGGTTTDGVENGRNVTTVTLDAKTLKEKLNQEGAKPTLTIPVNNGADIVRSELNGQMIRDMEDKEAVLEIKTGSIRYVLPAAQIDIGAISDEVGENVALSDIKVQIQISSPTQDTVKVIEDAAKKGSFALVVPPVEFDIKCTYGNKTVNVSRFNSYVERTVAIPDGVDPNKITTGVVLNPDGTVRHVPTKITEIGGKYYAVINGLTNSVYSVVWNPVEFADAANHWAKAAIHDMGSRMVIGGVGNGNFEPNRDITRAEFAAIIARALGLAPGEGENTFTDVSESSWYAGYVKTAVSYGIITGISDTSFKPDSKITREQAMSMVARAMKITKLASDPDDVEIQSLLSVYGDADGVSGYAKQSIAECLEAGIISGRTGNTIAPKENMTRAEVAAVIQKLLKKSKLI